MVSDKQGGMGDTIVHLQQRYVKFEIECHKFGNSNVDVLSNQIVNLGSKI